MEIEWSLKTHGDFLEKNVYEFVNESLQAYELIWKKFIGHKGNGIMAEMVSYDSAVEEKRENFAQNLYTILESLYFMKRICEEESSTLIAITNIDDYRKSINQVILFGAHLGRLVDCTERCFEKVDDQSSADKSKLKLKELYETRHILLHGIKFPVTLDDGLFMVPMFSEAKHGWHHSRQWKQINEIETKHISERLQEVFNLLLNEVSAILYSLLESVNKFIEVNHLTLKSPAEEYKNSGLLFSEISGSTISYMHTDSSPSIPFIVSLATNISNPDIFIQPSGVAPIKHPTHEKK